MLPATEFDEVVPSKLRSPSRAFVAPTGGVKRAFKKSLAVIPLPSFLTEPTEPEEAPENEEETEIDALLGVMPKIKTITASHKLPATTAGQNKPTGTRTNRPKLTRGLTIPVSPFFRTNQRAKRPALELKPFHTKTVAIKRPRPESEEGGRLVKAKVVGQKAINAQTLKSTLVRDGHGPSRIDKRAPVRSTWQPKLTEPRTFRFRTEERRALYDEKAIPIARSSTSDSEGEVRAPRSRAPKGLTEPQSPCLATKQRAQVKRFQSIAVPVDPCLSSTFEREPSAAGKFRNSLTHPQPFHFQTEDRAVARKASFVASEKSENENDCDKEAKEPWAPRLTDPRPFHFQTEDRAALRGLSDASSGEEDTGKKRSKAAWVPQLTKPQAFRSKTADRANRFSLVEQTGHTSDLVGEPSNNPFGIFDGEKQVPKGLKRRSSTVSAPPPKRPRYSEQVPASHDTRSQQKKVIAPTAKPAASATPARRVLGVLPASTVNQKRSSRPSHQPLAHKPSAKPQPPRQTLSTKQRREQSRAAQVART